MTKPKPTKLTYIGETLPDGRPAAHLGDYGIAPQDYSGAELAALSADQIKLAEDSGLYRVTRPQPKSEAKSKKTKPVASNTAATVKATDPPPADDPPADEQQPPAEGDDAGDGEKE